ncbi:MAG: AEC family transporter [Liquorilactobacillus nagelii]|jgi:predicted permease|uniref:AEC family transporter n=3 Tax=Lactobacillaceae TaxID=33958 RepID=UPI0024311757|nr:AEC family transporter [Liquorilactobacillus nagelii]MCI1634077.1 AEC family transporter [Liquorilactobacillus nagelii]
MIKVSIFEHVMLPVLLIFFCGFIFQRIFKLDIKPLSTVAIYLLLPFLVFQTFYKESIDSNFFYVILTSSLLLLMLILLGIIISKVGKFGRNQLDALLLSIVFPNSGNYGIPIVMFAFGNKGLLYGMPIMVFHNILMGTIGVYIAADNQGGIKTAGKMIFKQPMNYVILPAILLAKYHIEIPSNFMKSINLVGNTTIPVIMLILGMQLAEVHLSQVNWYQVNLAWLLRLVVSPLLAYLLCLLLPIDPIMKMVIITMAAMPSAANTTLYAIQFNAEPQFVSTCTLVSTITSVITLTVILNLLI